jgi:hypothetical protein
MSGKEFNGDTVSIPSVFKKNITDAVVSKLGLNSLFQLKDRFDGEYYLNKQLHRLIGSYVISKNLEVELLNPDKPLWCIDYVEYEQKKYLIITTEKLNRIKVPDEDVFGFIVVFISNDYRRANILGFISKKNCISKYKNQINSNSLVAKKILSVISSEDLSNKL